MRRATWRCQPGLRGCPISIHALLAESDQAAKPDIPGKRRFLSTLSLRRATGRVHYGQRCHPDFYPRSPCGERRDNTGHSNRHWKISIHALLAESDAVFDGNRYKIKKFLSTLSLRRATPNSRPLFCSKDISIHALLAESDDTVGGKSYKLLKISIHALLAESDRFKHKASPRLYISIHALLAESDGDLVHIDDDSIRISIHALLAESDCTITTFTQLRKRFLSTLSLRRATMKADPASWFEQFLSTLSLRRATGLVTPCYGVIPISIHALLAESDSWIS